MTALDFTVNRYGTDTSGRPIYSTAANQAVFEAALADSRCDSFRHKVVTVQGGFMSRVTGGGATDSAGYHDLAGCRDVRTWNLTLAEQAVLWTVMDDYGIRFWKRDPSAAHGGMDEHGHGLAPWDKPLAPGAAVQARQAHGGRDGLARNGLDYMPRKHPVLDQPPAWIFQEEMTMDADVKKAFDKVNAQLAALAKDLDQFRTGEARRDKAAAQKARAIAQRQIATLGGVVDALGELATTDDITVVKRRLAALTTQVKTALAADPDVDGPDNPAIK